MESLAVCIGEPSTREVEFISSRKVQLGDYVELEYEGYRVLGFVREVRRISRVLSEDLAPEDLQRIKRFAGSSSFFRGRISILGAPDRNMFVPRVPPEPGTLIYPASSDTLRKVFGEGGGTRIHLGHLLTRPEVPVYVDVNSIVNRHLAVLAITGGGKSNTVSVILEGILEKGGAVLVFDMHGEYVDFDLEVNGRPAVKNISLTLNPLRLSYQEFRLFANVDDSAYIQDRYLRRAFKETNEAVKNGDIPPSDFWGYLLGLLNGWAGDDAYKEDRKSITGVIGKVEDMIDFYSDLFALDQSTIVEQIELGRLNVVDLSHVDEKIADIVVSHVLRNALEARKASVRGESSPLDFPLLTVIEEAHVLASASVPTRSRYWISRIAREGRKFGLGLCLVTQRPKALDSNALSQANNMVILRLVEPGDQRHVQQASESLSADLVEQLPSLNVGEALVMGKMIPVPALVKIKKASAKRGGGDIDVVDAWKKLSVKREEIDRQIKDMWEF
ncbi:helicase HerA domain-containing protein [Thermovibrio ammonificans]|uniref:HerA-ATP synthase, barrel domain protein n=1 Tax=Thermovibrio ammonificans (strain DSM 15698 / JCM 12110 / HB-1) TaxID=648996 RepID=E8T3D7_THEA1|nr:ATP-binding protein [Thermovibrio ammonificans]ADU97269.1 HerA-ATP synthase, barrel domain protein [Thermovibrio ammonificans HB-1]